MKTISKMGFALLALLLGSTGWGQTSFGKYGPVNGIQMNTGATPYNFAAGITDIQSLLSASPGVVLGGATGGAKGVGTINATALYINGAAVGTSSGAVSSVGLTAPTCFGVTGSPVTAAGSLGLTLGGSAATVVRADGSCSNAPLVLATPASGIALTVNGLAGGVVASFDGTGTSGSYLRFNDATAGVVRGYLGFGSHTILGAAISDFGVAPGAGGNFLIGTASGSAIGTTFGPNGNVTIGVPPSGATLNLGALDNGSTIIVNDASATNGYSALTLENGGTVRAQVGLGSATQTGASLGDLSVVANTGSLNFGNGTSIFASINSSGVTTFKNFVDVDNDTNGAFRSRNTAGTFAGQVGNDHSWTSGGSTTNFAVGSAGLMHFYTNNSATPFLTAATTGAVAIAAPSSGTALTINGLANNTALQVTAPATSGQSYGITVQAGTTSADWGLDVNNAAGVSKFQVRGDGSGFFGPSGASSLSISAAGNVAIGAPSSGTGLAVLGVANGNAQTIQSPNTTSQSFGLFITAGTNSTDYTLAANTAAGAAAYRFFGDGGLVMGSPTGGDKGPGSINTQSLYVNGVAATIPQLMTWFTINTSAGGCTLAVNHSSTNAGSCVRNSAGNYDVSTTTSYPSNLLPACSASGNTVTGWELFSAPIAVNLISIDAYFNGVGADGQSIEVICIG